MPKLIVKYYQLLGVWIMNDTNRKVVLLKGDNNKWYEQAIFIMRNGHDSDEIDFVKEAEKIINSQMLYNQIADKYEEQKILMPIPQAAVLAPQAAISAPKAQVITKKPQAQSTRLDFKLNLTLLILAIVIAAVFVYNFI